MTIMEVQSIMLPPRTLVKITMDSGNTHEGYIDEADLAKVRKALEGKGEKTISITLHKDGTGGTNSHIQMVSAKIESLELL